MSTSPSSSSTSRTSTISRAASSVIGFLVFRWCRFHRLRRHGQREQEPGAFGTGGVEPDLPAKVLDNLPGHGQADAGARVGAPVVQALEDNEDPLGVLRLDADA